ncbi:hypothetical protein BC830DRAFT_1083294 [Chytriomyces sp. MP71]|nr:hypothetical protein BC830DRAFT_1083294 [Chytriomyces sp. MP71]
MATSSADFLAKWHQCIERRDMALLETLLAPTVEFHTPLYLRPKRGPLIVTLILTSAISVFRDFEYHREWVSADGADFALEFGANVPDKDGAKTMMPLKGIDLIKVQRQEDGLFRIVHFEVVIRPFKSLARFGELQSAGVVALAQKHGAKL